MPNADRFVANGVARSPSYDRTADHTGINTDVAYSTVNDTHSQLTLNVTGAKTETVAVNRHFVVTFNGTEFVPVVIYDTQTGAAVLTCSIDLATHRLVPSSCNTSN
jgi:hypothetical protein